MKGLQGPVKEFVLFGSGEPLKSHVQLFLLCYQS